MVLDLARETINRHADAPVIVDLLQQALAKSIKIHAPGPVPPLFIQLMAEDLGVGQQPWLPGLLAAGTCFYAAADLFDDIQDQEPGQPVIQASSPAQAINIANLLLMLAQKQVQLLPLPAEIRLALLGCLIQTGERMSIGQFYDIHATNLNVLSIAPELIFPEKAGAEFALFFQLVPLALGRESSELADYAELGREFGSLLQNVTDFFDIWVPNPKKLSQDLAIHKNSFPLYWAREDARWAEPVDVWLAGRASSGVRQLQLRRLLAQTQAVEKLSAYLYLARERVEACLSRMTPLPRLQAVWAEQGEHAAMVISSLQELRSKTRLEPAQQQRPLEIGAACERGLAYLEFIEGYKDVWEVQRWGFLGEPELLGRLFTPLLILEARLEAGREIGPQLEPLLAQRLPDGWHYYAGSLKIPPDTDDLGQLLQLVGRSGCGLADTEAFAAPLDLLESNLDASGFCPTWLCDGERYVRETIEKTWYGNACAGVMANLYYGLAHYAGAVADGERYLALSERGLDYLLGQFDSERVGWPAVHYPSHLYVAYLVTRLCSLLGRRPDCLAALEARILAEQSLDGSWFQEPQQTAFGLLFLTALADIGERHRRAVSKALLYLLDTQTYDGSWPGAPLFVRPGRDGAYETFAHPKLSTAFGLRALIKAQACLAGGDV